MNVSQPSVAAQILTMIEAASAPVTTSQIYAAVEEATNLTHVSVSCRDLFIAGKVDRFQKMGRWYYRARQPDLLGGPPANDAAADLARTLDEPASKPIPPKPRDTARRAAPIDKTLKLRTLDKLIPLVAEDIGAVLAAVRMDVEHAA